jgi:hypothetical protein
MYWPDHSWSGLGLKALWASFEGAFAPVGSKPGGLPLGDLRQLCHSEELCDEESHSPQ